MCHHHSVTSIETTTRPDAPRNLPYEASHVPRNVATVSCIPPRPKSRLRSTPRALRPQLAARSARQHIQQAAQTHRQRLRLGRAQPARQQLLLQRRLQLRMVAPMARIARKRRRRRCRRRSWLRPIMHALDALPPRENRTRVGLRTERHCECFTECTRTTPLISFFNPRINSTMSTRDRFQPARH